MESTTVAPCDKHTLTVEEATVLFANSPHVKRGKGYIAIRQTDLKDINGSLIWTVENALKSVEEGFSMPDEFMIYHLASMKRLARAVESFVALNK